MAAGWRDEYADPAFWASLFALEHLAISFNIS
jgi:hypothetical protein